jgi:23S rRNA (adenine2030-N6)-methyltransferase
LDGHYEHRFHAGNVGDVWKHIALLAWLSRARSEGPVRYVDTHAGAGSYALGATGEWTEGVGLLRARSAGAPAIVEQYLSLVGERSYPGSPQLARVVLDRPEDEHELWELDPSVHRQLGAGNLGDGLNADLRGAHVLIDPPYQDRREWELVPDAVARALASDPKTRILLWYPIKSYARPNAMHVRLENAGVRATALELLTSPLTSKKNRLNGSGVLLVNAEPPLVEELAALATWLGPRLALPQHPHFYTARIVGI